MTVIACDGTNFAADSQETTGGVAVRIETKLVPFSHEGRCYIVGLTGRPAEAFALLEHYLTGRRIMGRPVQLEKALDAGIMLVEFHPMPETRRWTVLRISDQCGITDVTDIQWAMGAGADFAMGAMAFGATAMEAAEIACKLDVSCSGPIRSIPLDQWSRAYRDGICPPHQFPPFTTNRDDSHGPSHLGDFKTAAVRGHRPVPFEFGDGRDSVREGETA